MAYENKIAIESCIKKVHEQQGTIEKSESIINEIEEVYSKAKAFDEIVNIEDDFVKYHGFSLSAEEYAKEVKEIISECMERGDDEY